MLTIAQPRFVRGSCCSVVGRCALCALYRMRYTKYCRMRPVQHTAKRDECLVPHGRLFAPTTYLAVLACLVLLVVVFERWNATGEAYVSGHTGQGPAPSLIENPSYLVASTSVSTGALGANASSSVTIGAPGSPAVSPPGAGIVAPPGAVLSGSGSEEFGMAMGETLSHLSPQELSETFDDLAVLGIQWVRADLDWRTVQPNGPDAYVWDAFDRIVAEANRRGMRVLPILTYTPAWARPDTCAYNSKCAPEQPDAFIQFARAAVARYAPRGVHTWEVWNEPNMALFWAPGADARTYTTLLCETYHAVHTEDRSARVVSGGLAPVSTGGGNIAAREYLEQMYEYGAAGCMDAVGYHPYTFPLGPDDYKRTNAWSQIAETEWNMRSIMETNGDGAKELWLTEYGAPTGGPGSTADGPRHVFWDVPDHVTEAYQATLLTDAVRAHRSLPRSGPLFWYSYRDLGISADTRENFFGLVRYNGSRKPAYDALLRIQEQR